MTADRKKIGRKILELRQALAMSQQEFGRYLRPRKPISQCTICAYERGNRLPSMDVWALITARANAHGVSLSPALLNVDDAKE